MADDDTKAQAQQQPPKPNPALKSLGLDRRFIRVQRHHYVRHYRSEKETRRRGFFGLLGHLFFPSSFYLWMERMSPHGKLRTGPCHSSLSKPK